MDAQAICKHVADNIGPQLQEHGFEAFVLFGYIKDGDGKVSKVQINATGGNPAYEDGLRNMQILAAKWGKGEL